MDTTHRLPTAVRNSPPDASQHDLLQRILLVLTIVKTKVEIIRVTLLVLVLLMVLGGVAA